MKPYSFIGFAVFVALMAAGQNVVASPLSGSKKIILMEENGTKHPVATISFRQQDDRYHYDIEWSDNLFADHFLSMRPFKCLEGAEKLWCRVPYPYDIRKSVTASDLTDLEYDTMFVWKDATEYGINLWNGIYYRMQVDGDVITGDVNELDLGILAAPPEDGNFRPFGYSKIEPAEASSHWLPKILIE